MKTIDDYITFSGRLPKWALIMIMAAPAYLTFGYMAYNKDLIYVHAEKLREVTIGADEVGVMRDRDVTLCEERGGVVASSGCIIQHPLKTGIHRIPITYDVEIVDTSVQTWKWEVEGWQLSADREPIKTTNIPVDD